MTPAINEHDLLAWIEGEPLADEAHAAVEQALEADADLRARVEAMVSDRAAIRAWTDAAEVAAPTGLASDAAAMAEREALLSGGGAPSPAAARPRLRITFPRLAAAAGLALLVAGATMLPLLTDPPASPTGQQEAPSSALTESAGPSPPTDRSLASGGSDAHTEVAEEATDERRLVSAPRAEARSEERTNVVTTFDAAPAEKALRSIGAASDGTRSQIIELDDAVALLRERRLLIAVRIAGSQISGDEPMGGATNATWTRPELSDSEQQRLLSAAFGTSRSGRTAGAFFRRADLPAEAEALERLLDSLSSTAGAGGEVAMSASPSALPAAQEHESSPEFWWRRPISEWRPRGSALIVAIPNVPTSSSAAERDGG